MASQFNTSVIQILNSLNGAGPTESLAFSQNFEIDTMPMQNSFMGLSLSAVSWAVTDPIDGGQTLWG
jgi:hypothetical protein